MAVALDTVTQTGWQGKSNGESYTANFPAGLEVGDLMIMFVKAVEVDNSTINSLTPSSGWSTAGWTYLVGSQSGTSVAAVYAKVATSGDVSAGSITLNVNTSSSGDCYMSTVATSITGYGDIASIQYVQDSTSGSSFSLATGLTPSFDDSLLLFFATAYTTNGSGFSSSVSGYAISNDDPTWTERVDSFGDSVGFGGASESDGHIALATASRTETSALGNMSATFTESFTSVRGTMIVIHEPQNVTVSPSVIDLTSSVQAPEVTGTAVVTPDVIDFTASVQAPTVSAGTAKWVNTDKTDTDPTISNTPKS